MPGLPRPQGPRRGTGRGRYSLRTFRGPIAIGWEGCCLRGHPRRRASGVPRAASVSAIARSQTRPKPDRGNRSRWASDLGDGWVRGPSSGASTSSPPTSGALSTVRSNPADASGPSSPSRMQDSVWVPSPSVVRSHVHPSASSSATINPAGIVGWIRVGSCSLRRAGSGTMAGPGCDLLAARCRPPSARPGTHTRPFGCTIVPSRQAFGAGQGRAEVGDSHPHPDRAAVSRRPSEVDRCSSPHPAVRS